MSEGQSTPQGYTLGVSARETERLASQANIFEVWLRQLFDGVGLSEGMSVLDLGSGAGDVSFLAREYVGDSGRVVGLDNSQTSLERSRERANEAGYANVTFREMDLSGAVELDGEFDAIVGRRVLTYLPNRKQLLLSLLPNLKPGGVMAFQEIDNEDPEGGVQPPSEVSDRIRDWALATMKANGTETRTGPLLKQLLVECGLTMVEEHLASPRREGIAILENNLGMVKSMLPMAVERGFVSVEESEAFEDNAALLMREADAGLRRVFSNANYNVWGRKPYQ